MISFCALLVNCAPQRGKPTVFKPQQSAQSTPATFTTTPQTKQEPKRVEAVKPVRDEANNQYNDQAYAYSQDANDQGFNNGPQINWGACPQLEPSNEEKIKKAGVITRCLEITPIPDNITRETIETHRENVASCALQMEGWFNDKGLYRFDKAETEIKSKKLNKRIEEGVLNYHQQCKEEAQDKYPPSSKQLIPQIQLYQACMDYFISEVCGIEVSLPDEYEPDLD